MSSGDEVKRVRRISRIFSSCSRPSARADVNDPTAPDIIEDLPAPDLPAPEMGVEDISLTVTNVALDDGGSTASSPKATENVPPLESAAASINPPPASVTRPAGAAPNQPSPPATGPVNTQGPLKAHCASCMTTPAEPPIRPEPETMTSTVSSLLGPNGPGGADPSGEAKTGPSVSSTPAIGKQRLASTLRQFTEQLRLEQPKAATSSAASLWVQTLLDGVSDHVTACWLEGRSLHVRLGGGLQAEIATRSRVPCSWEMQPALVFRPAMRSAGGLTIGVEGLLLNPLEGVAEATAGITRSKPWLAALADEDSDQAMALAWEWWQKEKHKDELSQTKLWRVIESSYAGLAATGNLLSGPNNVATLLLGALLVTRERFVSVDFSFHKGDSIADSNVQVSGEFAFVPLAGETRASAIRKRDMAVEIVRHAAESSSNVKLAQTFAPSAFNFAVAWANVSIFGLRTATTARFCKLFEQTEVVGGASWADRLKGALAWQSQDLTFKMCDKQGRVLWSRIE